MLRHYTPEMRWFLPLLAVAALAAESISPVVVELLRHVEPQQQAQLGPSPSLRAAAAAVPDLRRDAARAMLLRLEPGASPRTLIELTHAYLYLAQPADADRASRLAQAAMPGVDGLAFRAWAAQQTGDSEAAAEAAREGLKMAPGRPDLVAILKLTEGRTRERSKVPASVMPRPSGQAPNDATPVRADVPRRREAKRLLGEAVRAKNLGDPERARSMVRRAIENDPDSVELRELLSSLDALPEPSVVSAALDMLRTTETGREIAEFIQRERIPIRQIKHMPGTSAAYYDFGTRTIYLGPDFSSELPVSQTMLIGHEGYHAIQHSRFSMAPVLETEQGSWLRTMAIYEELKENGHPSLPGHHSWLRYYPAFQAAMISGSPKPLDDFVQAVYVADAELRKDQAVATVPRYLKSPMRGLLNIVHFPAFMNAVSAEALRKSISGTLTNGWDKLSNTMQSPPKERKWFAEWLRRRPTR